MEYQVWHKNEPMFMNNINRTLIEFPAGFTHVANVDTSNVGAVFQLTNHIDRPWWDNPEVQKTAPGGIRSTSVGDVIVESGSRQAWTIDGIGLTRFFVINPDWPK